MARARTTQGRFERSLEDAERDAAIARYKPGRSYAQVAAHFNISRTAAFQAYHRALDTAVVSAGREAIAAELIELDALATAAWAVLRANHVHVADGRVVKDDGTPILDEKPVLMAIDRILRVQERRARLLGLDAPTRQTLTVITEDIVDAELRRLEAEVANASRGTDRSIPGEASPAERTPRSGR